METVNLEEQIKMLVELQGLDTQIFKFEDELAAIPEEIKREEDKFKEETAHLKKLEDGVKTLQVRRKDREGDLQAKEDSIKKLQTQLYQLKTNKEYSAMQEEIGRIKADSSLIEEDIIRLLDETDAENKKIAEEKSRLKTEEAKLGENKKRLDEEAKRVTKELEEIRKQRGALAGKVDKTVLSKYEKVIEGKDGLAVVRIAQESCQGCFRIMPPQVMNEVRQKKDLVFCENCSRILYIEE